MVPDGRWLAFVHGSDLWIAGGGDFSHTRRLLSNWGGVLAFTPDSRFISTRVASGGAVLVPVAGGRPAKGLDGGLGVWSRSGRLAYAGFSVVYSKPAQPGLVLPVFVTDARGRHPRIVGRFPFDDHGYNNLSWLPDGKRVLFQTSSSCGGKGLYAVPASGGPAQRLNDDPAAVEAPAWSRDGTRIAYSVQKFECHLGAGESIHIATVAANGSDPQRVTDDGDSQTGSFDGDPSFSPDGRSIAFSSGTFDSGTLQTIALGGGVRTPIVPPAGGPSNPAWSADGASIAYIAAGASVMVVGATGGASQLVTALPPRKFCSSGRTGVVSRRHAARVPRRRRHLPVRRGFRPFQRTARDPRALRRIPVVLARWHADRLRRARGPPVRCTDRDHGRERRRHGDPRAQHGAVPPERAPQLAARALSAAGVFCDCAAHCARRRIAACDGCPGRGRSSRRRGHAAGWASRGLPMARSSPPEGPTLST